MITSFNWPACRLGQGVISSIRWTERGVLHLSRRGSVYEDTRDGARRQIISFCLDHPQQSDVVKLPIFPVGA